MKQFIRIRCVGTYCSPTLAVALIFVVVVVVATAAIADAVVVVIVDDEEKLRPRIIHG